MQIKSIILTVPWARPISNEEVIILIEIERQFYFQLGISWGNNLENYARTLLY